MRAKEPSGAGEAESLLARWSRRKRQAAPSPEERDQAEDAVAPDSSKESAPASRQPATPPPGDADMPPLESLGPESDYSGFMSPEVSEELRRLALRKLFHSPLYNITDGLDDYDDDFTSFAVLREAFHAKHGKTSASESVPGEGVDHETAGEAGRGQPAGTASAEMEQGPLADAAEHPGGEPAEEEEKEAQPELDAVAFASYPEGSIGMDLRGGGASANEGPESGDVDAPPGPVESTARRPSSTGHPDGHEEAEMPPDSSAGMRVDEKAAAKGADEGDRSEDRDTAGPEPDGGHRHG